MCFKPASELAGASWKPQINVIVAFPQGPQCRNLIKKPWAYNPQISRIHIGNPNKGPGFLSQVPTLQFRIPARTLMEGGIYSGVYTTLGLQIAQSRYHYSYRPQGIV